MIHNLLIYQSQRYSWAMQEKKSLIFDLQRPFLCSGWPLELRPVQISVEPVLRVSPPPAAPSNMSAPVCVQLVANAVLFTSVNLSGVFVRVLTERTQRKVFLQSRNCIEERLRLEDENEKQVRREKSEDRERDARNVSRSHGKPSGSKPAAQRTMCFA